MKPNIKEATVTCRCGGCEKIFEIYIDVPSQKWWFKGGEYNLPYAIPTMREYLDRNTYGGCCYRVASEVVMLFIRPSK